MPVDPPAKTRKNNPKQSNFCKQFGALWPTKPSQEWFVEPTEGTLKRYGPDSLGLQIVSPLPLPAGPPLAAKSDGSAVDELTKHFFSPR